MNGLSKMSQSVAIADRQLFCKSFLNPAMLDKADRIYSSVKTIVQKSTLALHIYLSLTQAILEKSQTGRGDQQPLHGASWPRSQVVPEHLYQERQSNIAD